MWLKIKSQTFQSELHERLVIHTEKLNTAKDLVCLCWVAALGMLSLGALLARSPQPALHHLANRSYTAINMRYRTSTNSSISSALQEFPATASDITPPPSNYLFYSKDIQEQNSFWFICYLGFKQGRDSAFTETESLSGSWVYHCNTRGGLIKSCCPPRSGWITVWGENGIIHGPVSSWDWPSEKKVDFYYNLDYLFILLWPSSV